MLTERISIEEFLQTMPRAAVILDVRSPSEFAHAHIPSAINLPLFNDDERAVVGTEYKQVSRESAIMKGLDFFGPKMRLMVEEVNKLVTGRDAVVLIYCWRGGMRSAAVAWLLNVYGYKVITLSGGYKSYRRWALLQFENHYPFKVLGGYTGSGKTVFLQSLSDKEIIIDLEQIAAHKGSAFGKVVPEQASQEAFENELALSLSKSMKRVSPGQNIWIEDESQRIGQLFIPIKIFQQILEAPLVFMEIDFEQRLRNLLREYGDLTDEYLHSGITRIRKRLGPLATKEAIAALERGDRRELFTILLNYYDKSYLKGLNSRPGPVTKTNNPAAHH